MLVQILIANLIIQKLIETIQIEKIENFFILKEKIYQFFFEKEVLVIPNYKNGTIRIIRIRILLFPPTKLERLGITEEGMSVLRVIFDGKIDKSKDATRR